MIIDGIEIKPGESTQFTINIARLPTRTLIDIPVYVSRALEPGPTVLFLAGMHGDEINGIEIIRQILREGYTNLSKGNLICIPILNIYGFINFSRDVPDGKDINRSFPGSERGSLASRVAHTLIKKIVPLIDYGVDFHTGGASKYNFPQIRCKFNNEKNLELAEAFAAPFTINADFRENSLRLEAAELGKSILVYEGGESLRLSEEAIREGVDGARRLMYHLGMMPNSPAARHVTRRIVDTTWLRAESSGIFHCFVKNGSNITKGQTLGMITDPFGFGDFELDIKATATGHIICVNNVPVINQGDALIHIGIEDDKES